MQLSPDERLLTPAEQRDYALFFQSFNLVQRPGSLAPGVVTEVRPEQLLSQETLEYESLSWEEGETDHKSNSLIQLKVQGTRRVQTWYLLIHIGVGFEQEQFAAVYDRESPARAAYALTAEQDFNPEWVATTIREMVVAAAQKHRLN